MDQTKIQANNREAVEKMFQANGLTAELNRVPTHIDESAKKHFHIVFVKVRVNERSAKNHIDVSVITKYESQYKDLLKNNAWTAYTDYMQVLHDPTQLEDYHELPADFHKTPEEIKMERQALAFAKAMQSTTAPAQQIDIEALKKELKAELRAEVKAEVKAEMINENKVSVDVQGEVQKSEYDLEEFEKAHPNQLRTFANEHNIDLKGASKKAEILPIIKNWINQANK